MLGMFREEKGTNVLIGAWEPEQFSFFSFLFLKSVCPSARSF